MTTASTLGQFLGYDVVGEFRPTVKFVRIPTENGGVPVEQAFFTMSPTEGALAIPSGPQGDQGDKGDPALPWQLQPDTYPTAETLQDTYQHLGDDDEGRAWFVGDGAERALYRWNGNDWEVYEDLVIQGPVGPPVTIAGGTVSILAPDAAPVFQVNGSGAELSIHIGIPQPKGEKGDKGDTTINLSSYVTAPVAGQVLEGDPGTGKLKPVAPKVMSGPYSLEQYSFRAAFTQQPADTAAVQVAELLIPPQSRPYRLMVTGHVLCSTDANTRVAVMVRVGNPSTGTLVAYGESLQMQQTDSLVDFRPCWEQAVNASNPLDTHGVLPANTTGVATTLYVTIGKIAGGGWGAKPNRAQIVAWAVPA